MKNQEKNIAVTADSIRKNFERGMGLCIYRKLDAEFFGCDQIIRMKGNLQNIIWKRFKKENTEIWYS